MAKGRIEIPKEDIIEISDDWVAVKYKGERWAVKYGKFVDRAIVSRAEKIILRKFGKEWRVASAIVSGEKKAEKKERTLKDEAKEHIDKTPFKQILHDILNDFEDRLEEKPTWGKNEVMRLLHEVVIDVLSEVVSNE